MSAPYRIRTFGDPVLKVVCPEITVVDDALRKVAADMLVTMYKAPGVGLAGTQIGTRKRLFVYDAGDGPHVVINPEIVESSGEWLYDEGCLSVPGQYFAIKRPEHIRFRGEDLDGNKLDFEANGFLARVLQHETDHLNGTLLLSHLDSEQRKVAMKAVREQNMRNS